MTPEQDALVQEFVTQMRTIIATCGALAIVLKNRGMTDEEFRAAHRVALNSLPTDKSTETDILRLLQNYEGPVQ